MELQDFVKNALIQLTNGVTNAQNELKDTGALINPYITPKSPEDKIVMRKSPFGQLLTIVHFEVVLAEIEGKNKKEGIGVLLSAVAIGKQTEQSHSINSVSKISFDISVAFPLHPEDILHTSEK